MFSALNLHVTLAKAGQQLHAVQGHGGGVRFLLGPSEQPDKAVWVDLRTFLERHGPMVRARLEEIRGVLPERETRLTHSLLMELLRQDVDPDAIAAARRSGNPIEDLRQRVRQDMAFLDAPAPAPQSEATARKLRQTEPDPEDAARIEETLRQYTCRYATPDLLISCGPGDWRRHALVRIGEAYLADELMRTGVVASARHVQLEIDSPSREAKPGRQVRPEPGLADRNFAVPLLDGRWVLRISLAVSEQSLPSHRWRVRREELVMPQVDALAQVAEAQLVLAELGPETTALFAGAKGEQEFEHWLGRNSPEHCLDALIACWRLLPVRHRTVANGRLIQWARSGEGDRRPVAARMQMFADLYGDEAVCTALYGAILSGFQHALTEESDPIEIAAWFRWLSVAAPGWLLAIIGLCATASQPAAWLSAMRFLLARMEGGARFAVLHQPTAQQAIALRTLQNKTENSWGVQAYFLHDGSWCSSLLQALGADVIPRALVYGAAHGRILLHFAGEKEGQPLAGGWAWAGDRWASCKPSLPALANTDALPPFEALEWAKSAHVWRAAGTPGASMASRLRAACGAEVFRQLSSREAPCPEDDLVAIVRFFRPTLQNDLEGILRQITHPETYGEFQRCLWRALSGQSGPLIRLYEQFVGTPPGGPGSPPLPVDKLKPWVALITQLQQ